MLRINLLPPYIFDKQKKVKLAILWGVVAVAAMALFIVWNGSVASTLNDAKNQLTEATTQKGNYDAVEKQIQDANAAVAVTRSKQTFIANAKTNNDAWPAVYEAMRDVTSPVILLESLAIEPTNHKALDFVGFAKDELTIARWWMTLRNAKDRFDSVSFNLPSHPYIPPAAANGTGGMAGYGGMMGGRGMGYPGGMGGGFGGSGMGGRGPMMAGMSGGMGSSMGAPMMAGMSGGGKMGGISGMGSMAGMGGMGGRASADTGLTEIEGRTGLNFTGVAIVKDTLAPPIAPTWPAGAAAAGGFGGGMGGMGGGMSMPAGMPGMGGGRMPAASAPAASAPIGGGKGKKGGGDD